MDLLSQINAARAQVAAVSGLPADAVALHPATWVRLEADLRGDLPFAVGMYTPARAGARPQVAGATVYVSDQVAPGQIYTASEAEIRRMLGLEAAPGAPRMYAVAITAHGEEPDMPIETHVQCFRAWGERDALNQAEDWITAQYAGRPGPWYYRLAVCPVVALATEQAQPM